MVIFTTPDGRLVGLNPDLIESAQPERGHTAIRLVDGRQHLVRESLEQVAHLLLAHRTAIVDGSAATGPSQQGAPTLQLVR
jgi:uncharacterized protein YlzI (FlbEa/FlbD family)